MSAQIFGLEVDALPEQWTPLEATVVCKCLDEHGEVALIVRSTPSLSEWESLGMLTAVKDTTSARMTASFVEEDEDESDEGVG